MSSRSVATLIAARVGGRGSRAYTDFEPRRQNFSRAPPHGSVAAFVAMIRDPVYREAVKHRQAAVEDSWLIRLAPGAAGIGFGRAGAATPRSRRFDPATPSQSRGDGRSRASLGLPRARRAQQVAMFACSALPKSPQRAGRSARIEPAKADASEFDGRRRSRR